MDLARVGFLFIAAGFIIFLFGLTALMLGAPDSVFRYGLGGGFGCLCASMCCLFIAIWRDEL